MKGKIMQNITILHLEYNSMSNEYSLIEPRWITIDLYYTTSLGSLKRGGTIMVL